MKLVLIAIVALTGIFGFSFFTQSPSLIEAYGPTFAAERRAEITKYHIWQARFNGTAWSKEQKAYLEKTANDFAEFRETDALALFTPAQVAEIFHNIGSYDTNILKTMYAIPVLSEKVAYLMSMTPNERARLWRPRLAEWAATHRLNSEQIEYFDLFARLADNPTKEQADVLQQGAIRVFGGIDGAKQIFGAIGPYSSVGQLCEPSKARTSGPSDNALVLANCGCSYGSWFNMSCSSDCQTATSTECTRTDDGCGFAGFYACDGKCRPSEESLIRFKRRGRKSLLEAKS